MTDINKTQASTLAGSSVQNSNTENQDPQVQLDPLLFAYMEIYHSVQLNHQTAETQAKVLAINAKEQEVLINREAGVNFHQLSWSQMFTPKGGKKTLDPRVIPQLEAENQEVSAIRAVYTSELANLGQMAQMGESSLNSVVGESQQEVQQGGSLMQMLTSLTNQISRI